MSIKGGYRIQMVAWIPILFIYLKSVINCVGVFLFCFFFVSSALIGYFEYT